MAEQLPEHPDFLWRNPEPKKSYEAVIIGGGGHGLATAYYLAKNHGMTDIAILERGWRAGGNRARNTTIIRSNYLWDESAAIYEHSLKLWEQLPEELEPGVAYFLCGELDAGFEQPEIHLAVVTEREFYGRASSVARPLATTPRTIWIPPEPSTAGAPGHRPRYWWGRTRTRNSR